MFGGKLVPDGAKVVNVALEDTVSIALLKFCGEVGVAEAQTVMGWSVRVTVTVLVTVWCGGGGAAEDGCCIVFSVQLFVLLETSTHSVPGHTLYGERGR